MDNDILDEAYQRLHHTGPEWGEARLTNHGPMAVEVLYRRGRADRVQPWLDAYVGRLSERPGPREEITDSTWREALGDGRRLGDWTAYLNRQITGHSWQDVLTTWWPRLLPGIAAGATHGVIRVGHAARALLAGGQSQAAATELADGLAFWAARALSIPGAVPPAGRLDPATALGAIPRIPAQRGPVAARLAQLAAMAAWPASVAALKPARTADEVPPLLQGMVDAATLHYLGHGQASPVLLVHAATAPNAVLHTLPALPREFWIPSMSAAWAATATIISTFAPAQPAAGPRPAAAGSRTAADALERAVAHGDEQVIKFTDTAAEVYERTGEPRALAAAGYAATLIGG
jgi:hypothetical protein